MWALGFYFLFAVYIVVEYVAVVGDFGAVLGGEDGASFASQKIT